jgi:hypothetical protein
MLHGYFEVLHVSRLRVVAASTSASLRETPDRSHMPGGGRVGECFQGPRDRPISPNGGAQDTCGGRGRPGLRMATPVFNRAWRTVSGLTWSSLPIEAQESPDA